MDGEDVNQILQSYTLVPPTQQLVLKALYPPFTSSVQQIIDDGVYPPLVNHVGFGCSSPSSSRSSSSHQAVCISVEGHLPPRGFLNDILGMTGEWRHTRVPWKIVDESDGGLIELKPPSSCISSSSSSTSSPPFNASATASSRTHFEFKHDQLPKHNSSGMKWIVTFKDAAEARRFVRCWHRRRYHGIHATSTDNNKDSDVATRHSAIIISVELLW